MNIQSLAKLPLSETRLKFIFLYLIDYSECKYRDMVLGIISVFSWPCLRKQ
jgi:hypothetical protein